MDGRGGCCIARYATGGVVYDAAKFDRIMLGFRPIAPKPASCGSSSGRSSPERKDTNVRRTGRGRRRRPATSSTSSSNKTKRSAGRKRQQKSAEKEVGIGAGASIAVVTLPLLPEPETKEERSIHKNTECSDSRSAGNIPATSAGFSVPATWLSFKTGFVQQQQQSVKRVVESWVTVESVTDTWIVDEGGLGPTDEQMRMALESDTCPGFISDVWGRVIWTNYKFREMVGGCREDAEVAVWLVVKETASTLMHASFTCRARVQYKRGKEMTGSVTLPCDVWSMEGGGFAWRLDVKAALSLGR